MQTLGEHLPQSLKQQISRRAARQQTLALEVSEGPPPDDPFTPEPRALLGYKVMPALALLWLRTRNAPDPEAVTDLARRMKNRVASPKHVTMMAGELSEGNWMVNGESVKFSVSGRLLDGQQRLMACVEANIPLLIDVRFGLPDEAFKTIDGGKKRTSGDKFSMVSVPNHHIVAAAARWAMVQEKGAEQSARDYITYPALEKFVAAHPDIIESARVGRVASAVMSTGAAAFCHYEFAKRDKEAADRFFVDLGEGAGLVKGDPVWVLRDKLIKNRVSRSSLKIVEIVAMTIRAWNLRRQRQTEVQRLQGRRQKRSILRSSDDGPKNSLPEIL